jgi:hypothetical protein
LPIYRYSGEIIDPSLAADPVLAAEAPDIGECCADCIVGGNLRKANYRVRDARRMIARFASGEVRQLEEYHRLPEIPLFLQRDDWPICCGDWCEFTGIPTDYEESRKVPAEYEY